MGNVVSFTVALAACFPAQGILSPAIPRSYTSSVASNKRLVAVQMGEQRRSANNAVGEKESEVIVVGGGWAGFGAASHLARSGVKVTLLEAKPSAGGLAAGWETAKGKRFW
ncbi:unnamed protein product [Discosporangium mesarthrocarpum]